MHEQFANRFYSSDAWKRCRREYAKSVGGLCEECLKRGIIRQGEQVHHKIALTRENVERPEVTLNWDNLQLLCVDCHKAVRKSARRWSVDGRGTVTVR